MFCADVASFRTSVKYPRRFVTPRWHALLRSSTFSSTYDLARHLTLAPRKPSNITESIDTSTMIRSITLTAPKQQPTWASDCAVVQSLREHPSIDRRRRTVDCCVVAFEFCLLFVSHRRCWIDPPGLICCKIANPALIVYPTNRLRYDSRARLCLMVVL